MWGKIWKPDGERETEFWEPHFFHSHVRVGREGLSSFLLKYHRIKIDFWVKKSINNTNLIRTNRPTEVQRRKPAGSGEVQLENYIHGPTEEACPQPSSINTEHNLIFDQNLIQITILRYREDNRSGNLRIEQIFIGSTFPCKKRTSTDLSSIVSQ